jgi:multicomponent K+:H+ antiporter subunit A
MLAVDGARMTEMVLGLIVLLPFLGSLCAGILPAHARNAAATLAVGVALACVLMLASLHPQVADGGVVRVFVPWLPRFGLNLYLRMDGYAWLFAMLVTFMGALVALYARYYLSPADPVPRFFSFLLAFMGAMLGIVLSGNLIQLAMFWELTSLTSFMLIAYWYHLAAARGGARMALIVTAAGGLCLLAGVLMLGHIAGSYDLDRVLAAGTRIRAHPWYPGILVLILLGALTKSAQFPFHFWLPHAMAAPTPVSAYLHSATMVKAGVFLLARLWPVLAGTDLWFWIVCGAGLSSLLLGALAALFQRDMKGVLAYSTISHLGLITLLLGMNSPLALIAAVFHMMNHATFKASLFMAAGIVDHETGTRDLQRLSGLAHAMPITATLATVAAAAMAGVPLLNGFLSKEMFFAETIFAGNGAVVRIGLPAVATLAGMFSVAYSLRFIHQVFFGPPARDLPRAPHEPTRGMLLPSALLVLSCLLVGIFPEQTVGPLLHMAGESILGTSLPSYSLVLWHGLTLPLLMSVLALAGGCVIYLLYWLRRRAQGRAPLIDRFDGKRNFDVLTVSIIRTAGRIKRTISSRRLQPQLLLILCFAFAAAYAGMSAGPLSWGNLPAARIDPVFALLWTAGAACAVGAATQAKYHRLAALIMVAATGLIVCVTFAWFSAPDLALTQIAVEAVTLVLILLGLRWLPRRIRTNDPDRRTLRARARHARDFGLAVVLGSGFAALTYAILTRPLVSGLSSFFIEQALPRGGGRNVVNVILVDFRGFDTLGEITVVAIVALTVYALLRRFRPAPESIEVPRAQSEDPVPDAAAVPDLDRPLPAGYLMVPAVLVRLLLPMAGLVSVFFLLRGHNAPGGGFVGGLVLATALIAQYMVGGALWVEARTRIHPPTWVAIGLLAAAGAGAGAWLAAQTFLTSLTAVIRLPLIGDLHLSTALLFDIGVYMLVVGATTLILVALAHQSTRSQRRPVAVVAAREQQAPPVILNEPGAGV